MPSVIWEPADQRAKMIRYGGFTLRCKVAGGHVIDVEVLEEHARWNLEDAKVMLDKRHERPVE